MRSTGLCLKVEGGAPDRATFGVSDDDLELVEQAVLGQHIPGDLCQRDGSLMASRLVVAQVYPIALLVDLSLVDQLKIVAWHLVTVGVGAAGGGPYPTSTIEAAVGCTARKALRGDANRMS